MAVFDVVHVILSDHEPWNESGAVADAFREFPMVDAVRVKIGGSPLGPAVDRLGREVAPEVFERVVAIHNRNHDLAAFLPAYA